MRILIIRHGDPDYEHDSLTETGHREAKLLADWLAPRLRSDRREGLPEGLDPGLFLYQSPLGRAQATAAYTLDALGMTAETLPWLREFSARIQRPDKEKATIPWDWLPEDLCREEAFFGEKSWMDPKPMAESDIREKYLEVQEGIDSLLKKHGYERDGRLYRVRSANHDTLVLFCHFGVESVILSHMLNCSLMPLWHGFCAVPTSVTTIFTEERRQGIASFRVAEFGATAHLTGAGAEPSFSARFCECFTDRTRHD